ncbi:thioredoxin domain-containing protein 15 [Conger conger]|uniref:thioredoxin domain-containing protein 15 n=1 Tax=Conger conger TaxID=82655 RepID=UPI002A5A695F|nr:thioredoxin domain-containing protein 15 [Conger conger]
MVWSSNTVEFICTLCFTAFVIQLGRATSEEKDETSEFHFYEDPYLISDTENSPNFVGMTNDPEPQQKIQFKTAEIADAVMGTSLPSDALNMESLIPKNIKDFQGGFSAPCEEGEKCGSLLTAVTGEEPANAKEEIVPVTLGMVHVDMAAEEQNSTESAKTYKVTCDKRNITGIDNFAVMILNASQDLMDFLNANSTECSLVLFYTTWCQFSANLAPHFNALPRVFPSMHFLALDASQHSGLSTRFGTVAVPNILLFQGVKPMARFNQTDRTLETLTSFIANQTGFEANADQNVTEEDTAGPLPSVPVKSIDWLLVFSILFISGFTIYAVLRTDSIRWLIPGQEHDHQD